MNNLQVNDPVVSRIMKLVYLHQEILFQLFVNEKPSLFIMASSLPIDSIYSSPVDF